MNRTREQFKMSSLLALVRGIFKQSHQDNGQTEISTADCLMSALAMFSLKYPSMLQFDQDTNQRNLRYNLRTLFGVLKAPCDTRMRERLDGLALTSIRSCIAAILALLQRSKVLEFWKFLGKYYLISLDGTGFFSSTKIHCSSCCEKHHRNGSITYHHQMVTGCIVHPGLRQVIPIGFEPIVKEDGQAKNDCERNASKRWLQEFRRQHPQLPAVIVADGLSANAPFIELLAAYRCHYILVCKKDDHKYLWDWFLSAQAPDVTEFSEISGKTLCQYRFMKDVPLNESHPDCKVTVVTYQEIEGGEVKRSFGWVTNLEVTTENVKEIVKGGRARWKIENETFNTLKNQGYNLEHNYGHGTKTLSNVLAGLMLLAFMIDQCLEAVNLEFKHALKELKQRCRLWFKLRSAFHWLEIDSWEEMYLAILDPPGTKSVAICQ